MALVPGESTIFSSLSKGSGWVTMAKPSSTTVRLYSSPQRSSVTCALWGHAFFQNPFTQKRVDKGAFAGIKFTSSNDQKKFVKLPDGAAQFGDVAPGREKVLKVVSALVQTALLFCRNNISSLDRNPSRMAYPSGVERHSHSFLIIPYEVGLMDRLIAFTQVNRGVIFFRFDKIFLKVSG